MYTQVQYVYSVVAVSRLNSHSPDSYFPDSYFPGSCVAEYYLTLASQAVAGEASLACWQVQGIPLVRQRTGKLKEAMS